MIHPSCSQILATIQTSFDDQIVPNIVGDEARSTAATMAHLLRHVALRIEVEGQLLMDDIARLRALLLQISAWFDTIRQGNSAALRAVLSDCLPEGIYPSLSLLGKQAFGLRAALVSAQEELYNLADAHGHDAGYKAIREGIAQYITAQLADEAKLVAPAFQGKGLRR